MKTEKYHIYLSTRERNEIVASLINQKNKLIEQGRYTHYVVVDEKIKQILSTTPHLRKSNKEIVGYKPKEKTSEQFYEEIKNIRWK